MLVAKLVVTVQQSVSQGGTALRGSLQVTGFDLIKKNSKSNKTFLSCPDHQSP